MCAHSTCATNNSTEFSQMCIVHAMSRPRTVAHWTLRPLKTDGPFAPPRLTICGGCGDPTVEGAKSYVLKTSIWSENWWDLFVCCSCMFGVVCFYVLSALAQRQDIEHIWSIDPPCTRNHTRYHMEFKSRKTWPFFRVIVTQISLHWSKSCKLTFLSLYQEHQIDNQSDFDGTHQRELKNQWIPAWRRPWSLSRRDTSTRRPWPRPHRNSMQQRESDQTSGRPDRKQTCYGKKAHAV